MRVWAWLHLPSATVATSVATSTKTVVVAGLLVGMTTTATAGVVMLGSSAVRMQTTQGQQPIPHLGASEQTGRTPVVVVPPIHRPTAATPEATPTPPVASTVSPPPDATTTSEAIAAAALPTSAAASAAQPTAPDPVPPAIDKAHAAATSATSPPPATQPRATTPSRPATPPSATPPPVPSPAVVLSTACGTITASQADRAVIAQYSCRGNAKPNKATQPANAGNAGNGQQDDGGEPSRGHVHRR